ncbi:MAG TPA: hypothetical protein V6D17_03325 [Candidatus Obscuribacterales bacterium]
MSSFEEKVIWQLTIGGRPVRPGAIVSVSDASTGEADAVRIKLTDAESAAWQEFEVYARVIIGGKDYLLMDAANGKLVAARLLDKRRLIAMDPDRFSSLRNALMTFLETNQRTHVSELRPLFSDGK